MKNEYYQKNAQQPAHSGKNSAEWSSGLTKREHFAGLAMNGLMSSIHENKIWTPEEASALAVTMADALLAELDK